MRKVPLYSYGDISIILSRVNDQKGLKFIVENIDLLISGHCGVLQYHIRRDVLRKYKSLTKANRK